MRSRRRLAVLCCLLALASCGGDEPELNNQQLAETIENVAVARDEPKEKGPAAPVLIALSREEIGTALAGGPGCEFSQRGGVLFVSVAQGSLAKVGGGLVHALPNGPTGPTGGFWASERYAISVGRLADPDAAVEATTSWPASLVLTDRRQSENNVLELEGTWSCPA
ncbi:MAG TPA: hypothetical protein VEW25_01210 [Allosphingosinicella sp.]|nr:hypothetical protein [Allosphingosinicella sp.]